MFALAQDLASEHLPHSRKRPYRLRIRLGTNSRQPKKLRRGSGVTAGERNSQRINFDWSALRECVIAGSDILTLGQALELRMREYEATVTMKNIDTHKFSEPDPLGREDRARSDFVRELVQRSSEPVTTPTPYLAPMLSTYQNIVILHFCKRVKDGAFE